MKLIRLWVFMASSQLAVAAQAADIIVAVASNFTAPMKEIAAQFEKDTGYDVKLAFGSSGKFFAQIKHGAPFQLFFSADQSKPAMLEEQGMIVPNSRFTYAIGALALWSAKQEFVKGEDLLLQRDRFNKLAIANMRLAPYGSAAKEVLENLGIYQQVTSKLVQGENIAQTYQFVSSGNADLGFVSVSQIMSEGEIRQGSAWLVPEHLYRPIRQDAVLLSSGENNPAARAMMTYLRNDKAKRVIESYGYKMDAEH